MPPRAAKPFDSSTNIAPDYSTKDHCQRRSFYSKNSPRARLLFVGLMILFATILLATTSLTRPKKVSSDDKENDSLQNAVPLATASHNSSLCGIQWQHQQGRNSYAQHIHRAQPLNLQHYYGHDVRQP